MITIIIKGSGNQPVLNNNFNFNPSTIFINNVSTSINKNKKYNLPNGDLNTIRMI